MSMLVSDIFSILTILLGVVLFGVNFLLLINTKSSSDNVFLASDISWHIEATSSLILPHTLLSWFLLEKDNYLHVSDEYVHNIMYILIDTVYR